MKKILFLLLAILTLSSCSSGMWYQKNNSYVWASDKYDADRRFASKNVITRTDRNGITETKSTYTNYTFSLSFYGYKLVNKKSEIFLYQGGALVRKFSKNSPQTHDCQLGGVRLIVDVKSSHVAYVRIIMGNSVLKSATY